MSLPQLPKPFDFIFQLNLLFDQFVQFIPTLSNTILNKSILLYSSNGNATHVPCFPSLFH